MTKNELIKRHLSIVLKNKIEKRINNDKLKRSLTVNNDNIFKIELLDEFDAYEIPLLDEYVYSDDTINDLYAFYVRCIDPERDFQILVTNQEFDSYLYIASYQYNKYLAGHVILDGDKWIDCELLIKNIDLHIQNDYYRLLKNSCWQSAANVYASYLLQKGDV